MRGAGAPLHSFPVGAAPPQPPRAGAPHEHGFAMLGAPGDFLVRRKSPKTHQEPPGSWTSGTRGRTPLDSPVDSPRGFEGELVVRVPTAPEGSAPIGGGLRLAAGGTTCPPQGVQGRPPGESLVTFFSQRKSPGVEGRSALPMGAVGAAPPLGERRGGRKPPRKVRGRNWKKKNLYHQLCLDIQSKKGEMKK